LADSDPQRGNAAKTNPAKTGAAYATLNELDRAKARGTLIASPGGSVLWLIGRAGRIERSLDAGQTWVTQSSPSPQDWIAGVASSNTVCWIVGRNGAIASTSDGANWEIVAPPALAGQVPGKLPDFIGVTINGFATVIVTSADQRRFATADNCITWRSQP